MFKQITISVVLSVIGLGCGTGSKVHTDNDDLRLVSSGAVLAKASPDRINPQVDRSDWRFFSTENSQGEPSTPVLSINEVVRSPTVNQSPAFQSFVNGLEPKNERRCDRSNALRRGNGLPQFSTPSLIEFSRVEIQGPVTVIAEYSSTESILIFADNNLLPLIEAEARDNVLNITAPTEDICYGVQPRIYVRGPQFLSVTLKKQSSLELHQLFSRQLDVEIDSGSRFEVIGRANHATLRMAPYSSAELGRLTVDNLTVDMAAHADAEVRVKKSLIGTMSSTSKIRLNSHAARVEVAGDGDIEYVSPPEDDTFVPGVESLEH